MKAWHVGKATGNTQPDETTRVHVLVPFLSSIEKKYQIFTFTITKWHIYDQSKYLRVL